MGLAGGLLMGAGGGAFHRQAHTNQPTPLSNHNRNPQRPEYRCRLRHGWHGIIRSACIYNQSPTDHTRHTNHGNGWPRI